MRILLVEDDRTIALGLEYSLKQEGFEPLLCHSAATATEVINHKIDGINLMQYSDLNLPDGNGYDLCQLVEKRQISLSFF